MFRIITLKQKIFSQSDPVLIRPKLASVLIQSDPVLIRTHLRNEPTRDDHYPVCRWISGWMVSLQQDTDIQKLLSNGNRIWIRDPKSLQRYFENSDFWKKLRIAQSFIYYFQKQLFSLLCHGSESVCGVISAP